MFQFSQFQPFIVSLLLGALLGFERTFAFRKEASDQTGGDDIVGGVRTFSLISLLGCLAAFLDARMQQGILVPAFIGVIGLVVVSYFISYSKKNEAGITTEISIIICFIIGVMVQMDHYLLATFIMILAVMILHVKEYLDSINSRIQSEDISAVIKFGIISFVILPVFDPEQSLFVRDLGIEKLEQYRGISDLRIINPYNVWLMVVLISAIGFTGYLAIKILGSRKGIGLTGFLGGLVSSTATTMTFARRSRDDEIASLSFALAILLACSTMFPRVLVEILVVNNALLPALAPVMGIMALTGFTFCLFLWHRSGREKSDEVPLKNPFTIMPAVKFGLFYAFIVFLVRFMNEVAGSGGMYVVSMLSGLTDVDAITLTMSQIAKDDPARSGQAARAITLAVVSNTAMKAGMAIVLGSRRLRRIVAAGFAALIVSGLAGLAFLCLS